MKRQRCRLLVLACGLGTGGAACDGDTKVPDQTLERGLVASYHAESTRAGLEILAAGGNAVDAFVAATFVDYVVTSGETSAAGPVGILVHMAETGSTEYVDGSVAEVLDPAGQWSAADGNAGKAFAVPGAVAALAELSLRHGALPLARVLAPAIRTAREGFLVTDVYAARLEQDREVLEASAYGRATFFPGGAPVPAGSALALPELADFLEGVAGEGAAYMYTGPWARSAVQLVREAGGLLTEEDLERYQVGWAAPRRTEYRGYEVLGPAGRAYGGLWAMIGLEVLEHTAIAPLGHYAESADALELMVRVARALHEEPAFFQPVVLDDEAAVGAMLVPPYTTSLWERVEGRLQFSPVVPRGSHSYHVVAVDRAGNVVTGTNTIEGAPFGQGLFVQGVVLNASDTLTAYQVAPGERLISPLSLHIVLSEGRLVAAFGAFGTSMIEVELEMLVDALDYELAGPAIAEARRFGTFPLDWDTGAVDATRNWLDPCVPASIVETLAARGLQFSLDPYGDLGFGVALTIADHAPRAGALRTYGLPVFVETTGE